MGDAWDDDEFEVAPVSIAPSNVAWDDEEEFEPAPLILHGEAPKLSKEKEAKLLKEKAYAKQAALDAALESNETEGERKLRERARDEDADAELADELFSMDTGGGGGSVREVVVQSIDGYALKTLKDHLALAHDVAEAFEKKKSKANFQTKCVKELLKKIEASLTSEDCDEIIGLCSATKLTLEKAKKQPTAKKAPVAVKKTKSKKDIQAEKAAHAELFGGFAEDEYAQYDDQYDDFM